MSTNWLIVVFLLIAIKLESMTINSSMDRLWYFPKWITIQWWKQTYHSYMASVWVNLKDMLLSNRNLQKNTCSWILLCKDPQQDKLISMFLRNGCMCGKTVRRARKWLASQDHGHWELDGEGWWEGGPRREWLTGFKGICHFLVLKAEWWVLEFCGNFIL